MFRLLSSLLLLGGFAVAQPFDLSQYRWENRVILLFAPSPENETYVKQLREFATRNPGVQDRDLVILHLFAEEGRLDEQDLSRTDVVALRERFEVSAEAFTFVLIGKDGGVKRRSGEVVAAPDLFSQIDSMPMRQREMREGE